MTTLRDLLKALDLLAGALLCYVFIWLPLESLWANRWKMVNCLFRWHGRFQQIGQNRKPGGFISWFLRN